jgi:polyhydroxyalkanoate synthesis regulator phasin
LSKRLPLPAALVALALTVACTASAVAAVPSDQLMSPNTRGYASVGDVETLLEHWNQTQFGQLSKDEAMQPFVQDMKRQIQRKISGARQKLGLQSDDLRSVAAGEMAFGLVEREKGRAAMAVTVDVTGRDEQVRNLLAKVDADLTSRGAKKTTLAAGAVNLTVYDIPPQAEKDIARRAVFFLHQDMLCASDSVEEAQAMVARFQGSGESLAGVKAYSSVMTQVAAEAGDLAPEVRWFVNPFGYARASRSLLPADSELRKGRDFVSIFESQGFDAIQGIGGYVNLAVFGAFEMMHRTAVYAPPIPGEPEKYKLAMRMLDFPNGGDLDPQPWVPRKLASYRTFNVNLQKAFDNVGTLFDAIAGYDNAFNDAMEGFETDPFGAHVKIREELVAHLGQRVTLITDYAVPITTKSERFLFAIELKNQQAVEATIAKILDHDPNAAIGEFAGKKVWELRPDTGEVAELEIDLELSPAPTDAPQHDGAISSSAVCVADGHLFVASHMDYLQTFLTEKAPGDSLADAADFREIDAAMDQLMRSDAAARCFVRTDEAYRPTYELLRQGKMPESETLLGRVLNRLLTTPEDEDEGVLRKQQIDGRELPNFEMVRRYFSPLGTVVRSTNDGWFIAGATMSKRTIQVQADAAPPAVTAIEAATLR